MNRSAFPVFALLAFAWCHEALSFSTVASPTTRIRQGGMTSMQSAESTSTLTTSLDHQSTIFSRQRHPQSAQLQMTTDKDNSNETTNKKGVSDNVSQSSRVILFFPLVFKFVIVLMIKFLTDAVVYPSLFIYRMARRAKRKIIGAFDRSSPSNIKPNGESK